MLHTCLDILLHELNSHVKTRMGVKKDKVIFADLAEAVRDAAIEQVVMSVVSIDREEQGGDHQDYIPQGNSFIAKNLPVALSMQVLFSSCFPAKKMLEGLRCLSLIIAFFQSKNYFNTANTPKLPVAQLDNFSAKLTNLDFQEKSSLWNHLGVPYKPSVLYRVETVYIEDTDDMGIQIPEVKSIHIQ